MEEPPEITEAGIRALATQESFNRGSQYHREGAVQNPIRRGSALEARVLGSEYPAYHVKIDLNRIELAECTCPYTGAGVCKHIIAVLLAYHEAPSELEERPEAEEAIRSLDRERLESLLLTLMDKHPDLVSEVEVLLPAAAAGEGEEPDKLPPPNLEVIQKRVRHIFNPSPRRRSRYNDDQEMEDPEDDEIRELLDLVTPYLARHDGKSAMEVLKTFTGELVDAIVERCEAGFEEIGFDDFYKEVGDLWAEAVLSADLTRKEHAAIKKQLKEWDEAGSDYGYESMGPALMALEQGWDDPQVRLQMEGKALPHEERVEEIYGDSPEEVRVARARLAVLERQGRREECLNLALALGLTADYLELLVRMGRFDEALGYGREQLLHAENALVLAKALHEAGRLEEALDAAEEFLKKKIEPPDSSTISDRDRITRDFSRYYLARWLRDTAAGAGQRDRALAAALLAFKAHVSLEDYIAVRRIAGEEWPKIREELLEIVLLNSSYNTDEDVKILLEEGRVDDAIRKVPLDSYYSQVEPVVDAAILTHPDWVFEACTRQFDRIADAKKSQHYIQAVNWLKKARESLIHADRKQEWDAFLAQVLARHSRKYSLVPMLQKLK